MKILKPVNKAEISGRGKHSDYSPILEQLSTLPSGLALPIECASTKEAMNLQYWCFRVLNPQSMYGSKWATVRRKTTVFISRAEEIQPERKLA